MYLIITLLILLLVLIYSLYEYTRHGVIEIFGYEILKNPEILNNLDLTNNEIKTKTETETETKKYPEMQYVRFATRGKNINVVAANYRSIS